MAQGVKHNTEEERVEAYKKSLAEAKKRYKKKQLENPETAEAYKAKISEYNKRYYLKNKNKKK